MGYTDAANHDQMHRERIAKEHAVLHNALASDLIARASVTPEDDGCQTLMGEHSF